MTSVTKAMKLITENQKLRAEIKRLKVRVDMLENPNNYCQGCDEALSPEEVFQAEDYCTACEEDAQTL